MSVELTKTDGGMAVLTLNRPEALNALSFDILRQIDAAFDEVAGWRDVRALLIIGAGDKAFCAGADIKELRNRQLTDQKRGAEQGQAVFARLDRLHVASVALVDGYALGGGAELAMACTFRVASRTAVFGLPEIKLGLIPGYGGTQRLPRLIGEARALEIIMTGRNVLVEEDRPRERRGRWRSDGGGRGLCPALHALWPAGSGICAPRRPACRRSVPERRPSDGGGTVHARLSHQECIRRDGRL